MTKINKNKVILFCSFLFVLFNNFIYTVNKADDQEKSLLAELEKSTGIEKSSLLNELAKFYWWNKDKSLPKKYGSQALEYAKQFKQEKEILYSYINISHSERRMKNYNTARKNIKKALKIAERRGNKQEILDVLIPYERIYEYDNFEKKLKEVVKISNRILSISDELGDDKTKAYFFRLLGGIYYQLGNISKAYESYNNAIETYKKLKNMGGVAHMLTYIGSLNRIEKNYEKALFYYFEAEAIAKKYNLKSKSCRVYSDLGNYYYKLKEYNKAIKYMDIGNEIAIETKNYFWVLVFYSEGGRVKVLQGKYKEAIENYLLKGLATIEKKSYFHELDYYLIILLNLSKAYHQIEKPKEAYQYALQALVNSKKNKENEYIVKSHLNLGLYHIRERNFEIAENQLKKGLKIIKKIKNTSLQSEIYNALIQLYKELSDEKKIQKYKTAQYKITKLNEN